MQFRKYFKIKAIANLCAVFVIVALMAFAFYRSFFDVFHLANAPEGGSVMFVGVGVLLLLFYWFLTASLLPAFILSLISAILLFLKSGLFRQKENALLLGRIGKFLATGALLLLFLFAVTILSKCVYAIFGTLFLTSAILDIVFWKRLKNSAVQRPNQ